MIEAHGRANDDSSSGIALDEEVDRSLVRVWGEIDLEIRRTAGELCHVVAARGLPVDIDAKHVTFMDSTGMSVLVRLARDGETHGYPVTLHDAPWMLRELLSITGVDQLLTSVETAEAGETEPVSRPGGQLHG